MKKIQLGSEIITRDAEQQERLHEEFLRQQIFQMNRARTITRISPVSIAQHLLESFAGTGFRAASTILRECSILHATIPGIHR